MRHSAPCLVACYKSVKELIKPVKSDGFFSVLMHRLFIKHSTVRKFRGTGNCKSNGKEFAVSAQSY